MDTSKRYSPEVRERAVRMVFDHQAERDQGLREGLTTSERERLKALERENRELRRANEILKTASAFFAQAELDRKLKR
ncbi:transposase orfB IS3/IS911 family [endosymbiont of unidentified scaly snail isolate Monju]|nr:transposase orfA IS3/IS911 family [endosymbiont of unidentified scaly snail isolate Monju]BAN69303.1 transposase orfA IS3/IS911 family [endosymbiont of unidentified scaly snail isolate Monju]BAN69311.1 transposase orfA IS3/IS911 family [endosymbiont of unidentified scaly snail isolate Monju]BAN69531.1 transposase orfB IS3/IS911 family [endosymbiont of unidentified scaly snail isolate Monju]